MKVLSSLRLLYVQVLLAIVLGILAGYFWPEFGVSLKPLGDAFVRLIKMVIAPLVFAALVPLVLRLDSVWGVTAALVLIWLLFSSLVYAHIGTMLIYGEVNNELQQSDHARPLLGA